MDRLATSGGILRASWQTESYMSVAQIDPTSCRLEQVIVWQAERQSLLGTCPRKTSKLSRRKPLLLLD